MPFYFIVKFVDKMFQCTSIVRVEMSEPFYKSLSHILVQLSKLSYIKTLPQMSTLTKGNHIISQCILIKKGLKCLKFTLWWTLAGIKLHIEDCTYELKSPKHRMLHSIDFSTQYIYSRIFYCYYFTIHSNLLKRKKIAHFSVEHFLCLSRTIHGNR